MNVIIAEDQPLLRDTLKVYLEKEAGFNIIGSVSNGEQAVKSCRIKKPDLIIMDIKMPVMSGLKATEIIKSEYPDIKILILTLYENEQDLIESILAKADGYLLKDIEPETLISALKLINLGVSVYKSEILRNAYRRLLPLGGNNNRDLPVEFSEIELDVIRKICEGKQNKVIAEELNYSLGSVKNKIAGILSKTNLTDRTQVVIYAIKQGLLS